MALSQSAVQAALDRAQRVRAQLSALKARSDKEVGRLVQTAEVAGTACVLGLAAGRYGKDGKLEVAGMPIDLIVGLGSLAAGIYCSQSNDDEYAQHFHAVGNGALALYLGRYGIEHGIAMKESAAKKATKQATVQSATPTAGWDYPAFGAYYAPVALPAPATSHLTPEEIAAMAQGVR